MSSFLKPLKGTRKNGVQFRPRGTGSGERIKEVLERTRMEAMGLSPTPTPAIGKPPAISDREPCPNPGCPNPTAPVTDGFCSACGRELDSSNIVSEVQFGESSSGAAVVHGSFVGADQGTVSRNLGPQYRRLGGGLSDNREKTIREARNMMIGFAHQLKEVPPNAVDAGIQIFKLVMEENWLQGRGMDKVVPVCLYTACRREDRCKVMLIDFAELVHVNVYELGHVFKDLNNIYSFQNNNVKSIIPEDLIYRFCSKLDFGDFTNKVAADAIRLCQRMGRDWMVMGRRPSGICGACILMAARMWNFRRTVREVVYVVKVTTVTIEQRLEEFTVTESSDLTIEDFLNREFLESRHDPPAFYRNTNEWQEKLEKDGKVRKRKRIEDIDDDEGQLDSVNGTPAPTDSTSTPSATPRASSTISDMPPPPLPRPPPDTSKMRQVTEYLPRSFDDTERRELVAPFDPSKLPKPARKGISRDIADCLNAENPDADEAMNDLAEEFGSEGMPENDQEEEEEEEEVQQPTRKRGRKKEPAEPLLTFNDEWERDEAVLEQQINEVINDPHSDEHSKALATAAHLAHIKAEWARSLLPQRELKMDEVIGDDEFADDPEVQFCMLSPNEVKIKESIWINANKDWLRKKQEKIYRKQMEDLGPPKRKRNRVKKPRIGEGQLTPASTPGEAAREVLKNRSTYSKRINYDAIESLFTNTKASGPGSVASQAATPAGSVAPGNEAPNEGDDDEGAEEENEETFVEQPTEVYDEYYEDQEQPGYDETGYDDTGYNEEGGYGEEDYGGGEEEYY
ncbi:uncharacterized protein GGS22DRAFT_42823 [Annulohypoxylon maeteangense]|uniref:uncharacterized protein n=1 Tax=Annulohypoxylon maeteangense TaxID=1927788 RepID=UPI00200788B4|nr:uncharacterized protein GGS22DRAFT_42823 [Annulohypoxylon maeteangense]KAI0882963.1 hypothetical protein GGS22DRAFT_42823 [Annulohypoxylon maeteangense]